MVFNLSLLLSPAFGCPTIATGTTSALRFDVAQVAIVRQDERTTFSVSVNPSGTAQEFALVMPVPEVLEQDEVRTLDSSLFATLDGYTAPRHVDDAGCGGGDGDVDADADTDTDTDADGEPGADVDVEAFYLVGEYAVTILSAEESSALFTWLDDHGYSLPDGAEERLGEYIEAGSFFLAAKVADTAALADGTPLSPLQVAYDSPVFTIPIRLATLNSPGQQDMVVYAIVDHDDGRVGIANYPEVFIEDTCVWGNTGDDFAAFYEDHYSAAWGVAENAAWGVEFSGGLNDCNPCTNTFPSGPQLEELGFQGDPDDHYMTRLHVRYTTEQATQDLSLYSSGISSALTTSFADDNWRNKTCIEYFCDGRSTSGGEPDADTDTDLDTDTDTDWDSGWVTDTDTDTDTAPDADADTDSNAQADGGGGSATACGCQTGGSSGWALLLAALAALGVRRRSARA